MQPKLAIWLVLATPLLAEDWTRFRGPNGSSVHATATGLPVEFGPAKDLAWKAAVPFGQSSPVLGGGAVFLTASDKTDLITLAYDATNGRLLWRRAIPRPRIQETYRLNDPASPTPATDAGNVYVFFPELGLVSFTADGKERWRHPLGPFRNFYGQAASPIVEGDLVILNCDQQSGSFLLAVDKNTGRPRWRRDRPEILFGWATPIIIQPAGQPKQIVVVSSNRTDGYYVATGEPRWHVRMASEGSMGSPVLDGETLFVHANGSDQPTGPTFDSLLAGQDRDKNGRLTAAEMKGHPYGEHFGWLDDNADGVLDRAEWEAARNSSAGDNGLLAVPLGGQGLIPASAIRWRLKRNVPYVPAPVLYNRTLFMIRDGGVLTSVIAETGALVKQGRAEKAIGAYYAQPVAADGKLYVVNKDGMLTVLKAQAQWEVLAVNNLEDEVTATPAIGPASLYVRTRATLYCFRNTR